MANFQKYARSNCVPLLGHYERAKDNEGNYYNWNNQDIDTERSHLNYNLHDGHDLTQWQFIQQRTSEVRCMNRKDVNVMCSWVLTLPQEVTNPSEQDEFFKTAYDFFVKKYGAENCISAWVHVDESQPHMHFAFVPVVDVAVSRKKQLTGEVVPTVSADKLITRQHLKTFHDELSTHMTEHFGRDMGVYTGVTLENGGNKDKKQLQKQAEEKLAETDASVKQAIELRDKTLSEVSELRSEAFELQSSTNTLKDENKRLQEQIKGEKGNLKKTTDDLKKKRADLGDVNGRFKTKSGIEKFKVTEKNHSPVFGARDPEKDEVIMLKSDFEKLKRTALMAPVIKTVEELERVTVELSMRQGEVDELKEELSDTQNELANTKAEKTALSVKSKGLQNEKDKLKADLSQAKDAGQKALDREFDKMNGVLERVSSQANAEFVAIWNDYDNILERERVVAEKQIKADFVGTKKAFGRELDRGAR